MVFLIRDSPEKAVRLSEDVPTPTPLSKGQDVRKESRCGSSRQLTSPLLIRVWKIGKEHVERVQIEVEWDCRSVNIVLVNLSLSCI